MKHFLEISDICRNYQVNHLKHKKTTLGRLSSLSYQVFLQVSILMIFASYHFNEKLTTFYSWSRLWKNVFALTLQNFIRLIMSSNLALERGRAPTTIERFCTEFLKMGLHYLTVSYVCIHYQLSIKQRFFQKSVLEKKPKGSRRLVSCTMAYCPAIDGWCNYFFNRLNFKRTLFSKRKFNFKKFEFLKILIFENFNLQNYLKVQNFVFAKVWKFKIFNLQ